MGRPQLYFPCPATEVERDEQAKDHAAAYNGESNDFVHAAFTGATHATRAIGRVVGIVGLVVRLIALEAVDALEPGPARFTRSAQAARGPVLQHLVRIRANTHVN